MEFNIWVERHGFTPDELNKIQKKATQRMLLWFILSHLGLFWITLPLFINAFTMRKIIKQRTFAVRPGIIFSLYATVMYLTFIAIVPAIIWVATKKFSLGSGIRSVIREKARSEAASPENAFLNEILPGNAIQTDGFTGRANQERKKTKTAAIVVSVIVFLILALLLYLLFTSVFNGKSQGDTKDITLPVTSQGGTTETVPDETELTAVTDFNAVMLADNILRYGYMQKELYHDYEVSDWHIARAATCFTYFMQGEPLAAPQTLIDYVWENCYSEELRQITGIQKSDIDGEVIKYPVSNPSSLFNDLFGLNYAFSEYDIFYDTMYMRQYKVSPLSRQFI